MSKSPFDSNFDPYNALIELDERINRMELVHNNLAAAFQRTEQELNLALSSLNHLQKGHLTLSRLINAMAVQQYDVKPGELKQ